MGTYNIITRNVKDYYQKLNVRVASRIAEQFRLMVLGNEKLLRLFTSVFIALMIRGFELVTLAFELVTRGFKLALLNFNSCF